MTSLPVWLDPEAWNGYTAMRKAMKKPMTQRAETLILKTLYQLKAAGHDPNEALDQSTLHNWLDIYMPKPKEIADLTPRATMTTAEPAMTSDQLAASIKARDAIMGPLVTRLRSVG